MNAKCGWNVRLAYVLLAGLVTTDASAATQRRLPVPSAGGLRARNALPLPQSTIATSGSWAFLTNVYPGERPDLPLLLTDGSVIVHESCTTSWFKLRPDNTGSYINGSWSTIASMPNYAPLYYQSQVLADGRVIITGGEYDFCSFAETNKGALYDPIHDSWTTVTAPPGWSMIGSAASIVRTDKHYQLATCCSLDSAIATISGTNVSWTILTAAQTGKKDGNGDEGWTTLPDQTFLTIDTNRCLSGDEASCTEVFDPATNTWTDGQRTCGQMVNRIGPAVLLPTGFIFAAGGTTTNCIMDTATGSWFAAPAFGNGLVARSAPAAVLPSGKALIQVSASTSSPSHFFEVGVKDTQRVTVTQVNDPPSAQFLGSYAGRMLVLPTGQVLWTFGWGDVEIYNPTGSPKAAWAPKVGKVAVQLSIGSKNNNITGRNFNGFTFGGYYGGPAQTASNYPLVRLTNAATKHVCYARTHDHNRMGIADGSKSRTKFDIPKACEAGASSLEVVANGIPSAPAPVTLN